LGPEGAQDGGVANAWTGGIQLATHRQVGKARHPCRAQQHMSIHVLLTRESLHVRETTRTAAAADSSAE
jgi:hypothetical protein